MRITKVNIPENNALRVGLKPIKMEKLGQVVLLAGKNGSGKSRILNLIVETLSQKIRKSDFENALKLRTNLNNINNNLNKRIADAEIKKPALVSIETLNADLRNNIRNIEANESRLNWDLITTNELADEYSIVYFVPKQLHLTDSNDLSKRGLLEKSSSVDHIGMNYVHQGSFAKIQQIQDTYFEATHQLSEIIQGEKDKAVQEYEKLNNLIEIFLNKKLGRSKNGEATLFGFPLGQSQLSDGQKILIQFCLAIYSQEAQLKDLILVLDEPENHLHPLVIIETIESIIKCVPNGQVWIATHSIPLLAHFDPTNIWYVEDARIEYGGSIPEKVLSSLLGDENEIAKLQDFISLPAQFATSRYAFESLLEPAVAMTNAQDRQTSQIRAGLLKNSTQGKLKVLDYGVGKGRLISNIFDRDEIEQSKLIESLDYIGFDKFIDDKQQCEAVLSKIYGSAEMRYYNEMDKLLINHDEESFDVVIMCNVLHEIEPKDWITLFKENGTINRLLKDTGVLLIVEDNLIPTGEKAYQNGFLVLDTPELKDLFNITSTDEEFIIDQESDGRLKAHQIPKKYLKNISSASRDKAIKSVKEKAKTKIKELRADTEKNYKKGKLHGFWTQQLANAELILSENY